MHEYEMRIRCCGCRKDSFLLVAFPAFDRQPPTSSLERMAEMQLVDYRCEKCEGRLAYVAAILGADEGRQQA